MFIKYHLQYMMELRLRLSLEPRLLFQTMKDTELMRSVRRRCVSRVEQDVYWISSYQCVPAAPSSEQHSSTPMEVMDVGLLSSKCSRQRKQ